MVIFTLTLDQSDDLSYLHRYERSNQPNAMKSYDSDQIYLTSHVTFSQ